MVERTDEIREQIDETRERVGDTVDALAYKADVPQRTRDWVNDKKTSVISKVSGTSAKLSDATPDSTAVVERVSRAKELAERNPFGLVLGGAAVGFLAGLFAPSTRFEDERLGPAADELKAKAGEAGQEALERGKQVALEAGQAAAETAKEQAREQGQQLSSSLQEKAKETTTAVTNTENPPLDAGKHR